MLGDGVAATVVAYQTSGADVLTTAVFKLDTDADLPWQWDDTEPADEGSFIDDVAVDRTNDEILVVMRKEVFDTPSLWLGRLTE